MAQCLAVLLVFYLHSFLHKMTAKQFYLNNPEYITKAKYQEMKAIIDKVRFSLSDVKEFFRLTNRPKNYVSSRMQLLSQEYYKDTAYKVMYGSEMNYILDRFREEMKQIINKK